MKAIAWILIIAAVAVGGYSIYQHKNAQRQDVAAVQEQPQQEQPAPSGKKMAFSAFVKQNNDPYQCTVQQYLSDMDNSGTVYLNAGMIRGDFSTVAEGKTMQGSFLLKDGMQYVWQKGSTMGFKMAVSTNASGDTGASANGTYTWNAEQIGEYDCKPWTADASLFVPPTNVKFTDMTSFKAR
jgi:hypothetical protein